MGRLSGTEPATKRGLITASALAVMVLFRFLPPPAGMTAAAMQVIGIFIGVLLLWLTISIDWPSLLCILALSLVPGLKLNSILAGSVGNATFSFLLFTFLCTYALSQTPFIRRCAVAFVTSAVAKKGPWWFCALFFASVLFLGSFISPTVLFVIYLPIIEEIYAVLHIQKGDKAASMLMMGLVFCCGISSGMTPIAHVFPMMAMGYYQTATGEAISQAAYMGFGIPTGLVIALIMMLCFRFLLRPDLTSLRVTDAAALKQDKPMDRREKTILAIFALVVALWVLPSLLEPLIPTVAGAIDGMGSAFPPLVGAVLLSILTAGGKPLLDFKEGMSKGVPWGSLMMCAGTLALGAAITNSDIGLTAWLSEAIAPVTVGMAPFALVLLFTAWAAIQTNLSSNMVTVTVVTAIAIPVCLSAGDGVSTAAVSAIIGMMASCAFATPPAMPCVAIAGASGWTTSGSLLKYGSVMALACVAVASSLGYQLALLFL